MNFYSVYDQGFVRVAACTPICEVGDPDFNSKATLDMARQGHQQGVGLMVFPELGISGYSIDDLLGQDALLKAVDASIAEIVAASAALTPVLLVGAPLQHEGRLYNCAIAIHAGRILGVVPKTHLPNYREFYEKRWFASGREASGEIAVAARKSLAMAEGNSFRRSGSSNGSRRMCAIIRSRRLSISSKNARPVVTL